MAVPAPATGEVVASPERPKIFNQMCIACHSLEGQGGVVGPALDGVGDRRSYDNLVAWITDPQQLKPGTLMPKLPLTQADVVELASSSSKMKQRCCISVALCPNCPVRVRKESHMKYQSQRVAYYFLR